MAKLHEDYYIRQCFLERNEVPNQSLMKNKMGALANIYFKSMSPQVKMLAGFDPPLNGGGKDWYIPPMELLNGRVVLKPIERKHLKKLSCDGIFGFGEKLVDDYLKKMEMEKQKLLAQSDLNWEKIIDEECERERNAIAADAEKQNTSRIEQAFQEFNVMYRTSVTKIESLLSDAGFKEIQRVKERALREMSTNFKILLKQQSKFVNNIYKQKLETEKSKIKGNFITDLEEFRINRDKELQEIRFAKHVAVEKIRTLLEYQILACQVYVALKEQIECNKYLDISKRKHENAIKKITDKIAMKDFEINLAREKQKKQNECKRIWQKKICHVVNRFQEFVKYCLKTVPDYADFFINMEKLMLLHLGDTLEIPSAKSIFEFNDDENNDQMPPPTPNPFYLICDEGFKPQIDPNLYPKHCLCGTSQLPAIVVNKRCMYAACDNLDLFIDQVQQFVDGKRGNDEDFIDDHDYTYDVPIDCTSSDELKQLHMESSLMQILQNTIPNVKQVPTKCKICNSFYCFCTPMESKTHSQHKVENIETAKHVPSGDKITLRTDELKHIREPKTDSYLNYILPSNCKCTIMRKKQLQENLPAYMKNISKFETVDIPDYEICNLNDLKRLVHNSRNVIPEVVVSKTETKMKNAITQTSDHEYDDLCNCYSDDQLQHLFKEFDVGMKVEEENPKPISVFGGSFSPSHLDKQPSYFALETARKLKEIIRDTPELQELFKKEDCNLEKKMNKT